MGTYADDRHVSHGDLRTRANPNPGYTNVSVSYRNARELSGLNLGPGTPVLPGLVVEQPDGPRLLGSECGVCGTVNFPATPFCTNPDCVKDRANVEAWHGGPDGVLWSWTVQHVRAPAPFRFDREGPYAVGMVDLPGGVRVLGLLTRTTELRHDMPVRLVIAPLYDGGSGPVVTWMWAPAE
ncbi:Zn-ribbon domain-containing OB-fold protein [Actinophytocola sp.]|uniref:Zn-ribbon domain-containing OB-fold protein n=1 Tax=Actinophytocola sp. TaxID=1872138 RepID=UPI003D6A1FD4